jgi:hypothetical protein
MPKVNNQKTIIIRHLAANKPRYYQGYTLHTLFRKQILFTHRTKLGCEEATALGTHTHPLVNSMVERKN